MYNSNSFKLLFIISRPEGVIFFMTIMISFMYFSDSSLLLHF